MSVVLTPGRLLDAGVTAILAWPYPWLFQHELRDVAPSLHTEHCYIDSQYNAKRPARIPAHTATECWIRQAASAASIIHNAGL